MTRFFALILALLLAGPAFGDIHTGRAFVLHLESSGVDSSDNGRNFAQTGTVPHAAGKLGNGASPTSTNYYNFATPTFWDSKSAYTVAFWCKDSAYGSSEAAISWGTAAAGASTVIYPFDSGGGNGCKIFSNGVSFPFKLTDSRPAVGSWQFVCLVVESAASAKIYVNGDSPTSYSATSLATAASQTHFRVGHYHNGGQTYSGEIDEIWAFTRALTAGDVAELYAFTGATLKLNHYARRRR